jgi:hypothetical protein
VPLMVVEPPPEHAWIWHWMPVHPPVPVEPASRSMGVVPDEELLVAPPDPTAPPVLGWRPWEGTAEHD